MQTQSWSQLISLAIERPSTAVIVSNLSTAIATGNLSLQAAQKFIIAADAVPQRPELTDDKSVFRYLGEWAAYYVATFGRVF